MKYESSMTHLHKDILATVKLMCGDNKEITEKFSPADGSPAPLRDYLKNRYKNSGQGNGEIHFFCTPAKGMEITLKEDIDDSEDDKLTLSWSQLAKFMRDNWDEIFTQPAGKGNGRMSKRVRELLKDNENNVADTKRSYKDILLEHYPDFDVSRFEEYAYDTCVSCHFMDSDSKCTFKGDCKEHWESECKFEWRDEMSKPVQKDLMEYLISKPSESISNPEEDNAAEPSQPSEIIPANAENLPAAFDYSELDSDTANSLRECENVIRQKTAGYFTLMGEKFKEAQRLLANHDGGTFEKWYTALGFKRQTVYNLIQRYDFLSSPAIEGRENAFEELPATLSYEISKPGAPSELVEKVLDGDITTNAEYQRVKAELERVREECRRIDANSAAKDKEYARELEEANKRAENAEFHEKTMRESYKRIEGASEENYDKFLAERDKNIGLEKRIKELESRPIDVTVQQDEGVLKELEQLRKENERLKDKKVKNLVLHMTMEEFKQLLEITKDNERLHSIVSKAALVKL